MFNFLFNIQLFIQRSTFYSTFNYLFNVQLFIQHSIVYSMFNFFSTFNYLFNVQLFSNIQLFIHCLTFSPIFNYLFNIQLFIQRSIIHSMFNFYFIFNFLEPSFFSGQWLTSFPGCTLLSRNMVAIAADIEDFAGCGDWSTKILPRLCSGKRWIYLSTKRGKENCGAAYRCCGSDGEFASLTQRLQIDHGHSWQRNFKWSFINFQRCFLCYAAMYHCLLLQQPRIFDPNLQVFSLRVAVPSPQGKTGGRERLRKADTNRVMWRHAFAWKYIMASYWIKATSNTFENTYWLRQIYLVFMTSADQ